MNKYKCISCGHTKEVGDLPTLMICGECQGEMILMGWDE